MPFSGPSGTRGTRAGSGDVTRWPQGIVYVLVNSSMPGLIKVGKTRRLPSERVQELSSATGVATPFVVAFEELFDDCDTAEEAVHAELGLRGFRQAQNREFFRATTNEVIRIILGVAARSKPPSRASVIHNRKDLSGAPWDDLIAEASDLLYGSDNVIQDPDEAIRLYKIAAQMGSPEAFYSLGCICLSLPRLSSTDRISSIHR